MSFLPAPQPMRSFDDAKRDELSHRTNEGQKAKRLLNDVNLARNEIPEASVLDSSILKAKEQAFARLWTEVLIKLEATEHRRFQNMRWFRKGTNDTLDAVARELQLRPPTLEIPDRPSADMHVNAVVLALWTESTSSGGAHQQLNAWPVFGGVCYNLFKPRTDQWVARPLSQYPLARQVTVNWVTNLLYSHVDSLMAHCEAPPPSPSDLYTTIPIPTAIADQDKGLLQEVKSEIHIVHIPQRNTYHLTKYRKYVLFVPAREVFKVTVDGRKRRRGQHAHDQVHYEELGTLDKKDGIMLMRRGSKYGQHRGSAMIQSQWILSREFEDEGTINTVVKERYCTLACSISSDMKSFGVEHDKFQHEWANWSVYQKRRVQLTGGVETDIVELIEMAVSTGIQHADTLEFVPYDGETGATPHEVFSNLVASLTTHYTNVFRDANTKLVAQLRSIQPGAVDTRRVVAVQVAADVSPARPVEQSMVAAPQPTMSPTLKELEPRPRKRSRRNDVFEAAILLSSELYSNEFDAMDLARVANVFASNADTATLFLGLGPAVQRAWVADHIDAFRRE
ncbi:hypothetical protein DYB25_005852 [Aphanomyces astaci]|uniref:Uncharacterized protein n=1 Tax=Aphanomyces astaci TaxID=112090 RepID=A0A397BI98_APHAT|nr:hypothetical protein DYB25_005852 [Aphanomyces astaci]